MRDFSSARPLSSDEVDRAIVETREKVNHTTAATSSVHSCHVANKVQKIITVGQPLSGTHYIRGHGSTYMTLSLL